MTGGKPDSSDRSVKSLAMLGCKAVENNEANPLGRMISVLPNGQPRVDCVSGQRRVELTTGLESMGRNPITGGTPDLLIALKSGAGVGTLVELAFGVRKGIQPVFVQSVRYLEKDFGDKVNDFADAIKTASEQYRLDAIETEELQSRLGKLLKKAEDIKVDGQDVQKTAAVAVKAALDRKPHIGPSTNFEGLPDREGKRCLKREFDNAIHDLSALGPEDKF
jgi:hypothetical protein